MNSVRTVLRLLAAALLLGGGALSWGQSLPSFISLRLLPAVDFPVAENASFYQTLGGSGRFGAAYQPPIRLPLTVDVDITYGLALLDPTALPAEWRQSTDKSLHTVAVSAGLGSEFRIAGRLEAGLYAHGGYYYGLTQGDSGETVAGGNPYVTGGAQLQFRLSPQLAIGAGASWRSYLGAPTTLLNQLSAHVGTSYRIPLTELPALDAGLRPSLLQFESVSTGNILPVFYQYYDKNPIGSFVIRNGERAPISDLRVSVNIRRYMDSPKQYAVAQEIGAGEAAEIELFALFNEEVLSITKGTVVPAEISVSYALRGDRKEAQHIESVRLENRNGCVWDDDRRAAAFGFSAAISGDYAIVGEIFSTQGGSLQAGAAYVFERGAGDNWDANPAIQLLPTDAGTGDWYGAAVAIEGDHLLVSSPFKDDHGDDAGAVFRYERSAGGTWEPAGELLPADVAESTYLGRSVAMDDTGLAVVGATDPFADAEPGAAGAVYVYD